MNRETIVNATTALSRFSAARSPMESYLKLSITSPNGMMRLQAQSNNGVASVQTDVESSIEAQVDFRSFHSMLSRSSAGEIKLSNEPNRLRIQAGDRLDVKLPRCVYTVPTITPSLPIVEISRNGWMEASGKMGLIGIELETTMAPGVRILSTAADTVSFLMSTKSGMCGCTVEAKGDGIDATIPVESLQALSTAVKIIGGDTVSLGYHNNWMYAKCGPLEASVPTVAGIPPYTRETFEKIKGLDLWDVPLAELREAVRQAEVFSETGASGLDIFPAEDGLHILKQSVNDQGQVILDSPGECEYVIPGRFSGPRLIIKREFLASMLKNCSGDDFRLYASPRNICVESGNYFAGQSCMTRVAV